VSAALAAPLAGSCVAKPDSCESAPAFGGTSGTAWRGAGRPMIGGSVDVRVTAGVDAGPAAEREASRALDRIEAWARRLTRFDDMSELSRLTSDPRSSVPIGPTLAAVLDWARIAEVSTDGIVDVTLLDARLAAEHGSGRAIPAHRRWSLERTPRGAVVRRSPGVRFDLDGVAKGWLADRALDLVRGAPSAIVDADGDVAVRLAPGMSCAIGVADPRTHAEPPADAELLAVLAVPAADHATRYGIATSGTSVHRWRTASGSAHHLIDPRTCRPAATDLVQATVLASSARSAEALAKAVVILGLDAGLALLGRSDAVGALLLTERGETLATPRLARWLS
jgi:FAD:protein FMN transferase